MRKIVGSAKEGFKVLKVRSMSTPDDQAEVLFSDPHIEPCVKYLEETQGEQNAKNI